MSQKQRKIGLLTSGGDAPGMNAAIRAIVRAAANHHVSVMGIKRGFEGLLHNEIVELKTGDTAGIIRRGGTILLTARCPGLMETAGQNTAAAILKEADIDTLIVIGGDGTFRGAMSLAERGVNILGIPATIDLDMPCTEYSLGFDTACNTGMDAIGRIMDTSMSHERCSVVEVMGRGAGYLALWCGLTSGAEIVLIPEDIEMDTDAVIKQIKNNRENGKTHNLVVIAEGVGGSNALAREIQRVTGIESRATILGHLQRGGSPTAVDRMHGTVMGYMALESVLANEKNKAVVVKEGRHVLISLDEAIKTKPAFNPSLYEMSKVMSI
ncbi:MAG: 6-phosphofructokinase [Defluviitaleaceae bacterium]|nr:6-phosphofructokinase [Defluviitaleaceae bacterium]